MSRDQLSLGDHPARQPRVFGQKTQQKTSLPASSNTIHINTKLLSTANIRHRYIAEYIVYIIYLDPKTPSYLFQIEKL